MTEREKQHEDEKEKQQKRDSFNLYGGQAAGFEDAAMLLMEKVIVYWRDDSTVLADAFKSMSRQLTKQAVYMRTKQRETGYIVL